MRPLSPRGLQITVLVEMLWLVFVSWTVGRSLPGEFGWDIKLINVVSAWAPPALAILVMAVLISQITDTRRA